jgi:hypothetical protein
MKKQDQAEIERRLLQVLCELQRQEDVASNYPPGALPFADEMRQIEEYIKLAGEYEIAYETLVATISTHPYILSGKAAISLLEVALILGYKTGRKEDEMFDRR